MAKRPAFFIRPEKVVQDEKSAKENRLFYFSLFIFVPDVPSIGENGVLKLPPFMKFVLIWILIPLICFYEIGCTRVLCIFA